MIKNLVVECKGSGSRHSREKKKKRKEKSVAKKFAMGLGIWKIMKCITRQRKKLKK